MLEFLINIIVFFVSLALLVIIHEFGHFITAKIFNVYVNEFSIGFGPLIYSHKKDGAETKFSIRGVPLGGYCAMVGNLSEINGLDYDSLPDDQKELVDIYKTVPVERSLDGVKRWKKAIIMGAGVTLNFLLGFILLIVFYASTPVSTMISNKVGISSDSIAYRASWESNDEIIGGSFVATINNQETKVVMEDASENTSNFYNFVIKTDNITPTSLNDTIAFTLLTSENKEINFVVTPYSNEGTLNWEKIGISFYPNREKGLIRFNFAEVMQHAASTWWEYATAIFTSLGMLFTKEGIQNVGGLVSIFTVQQEVMSLGFSYVVNLWALISINLGIMNLLPFPGLDGWHLLVTAIEGITKKEIPANFKNIMSNIGMMILLILSVVILFKDIFTLI